MTGAIIGSFATEAPAMLVPSVAHSRSVAEAIQEVKVVQVGFYIVRQMCDFP
jgi:hypothetical protein